MTHKAILKLAGYEVIQTKRGPYVHADAPCWVWKKREEGQTIYSQFYHKTETRSWTNAWKHYKKGLEQCDT